MTSIRKFVLAPALATIATSTSRRRDLRYG
jgi:hypothetical protein